MKLIYFFAILFATRAANEGKKEFVGLSTESEDEIPPLTVKARYDSFQISQQDLDDSESPAPVEDRAPPLPTAGDEYVPEKLTGSDERRQAADEFYNHALTYLERGKGHGRDGRLAAYKLLLQSSLLGHEEAKKLMGFAYLFGDYTRWSIEEAKDIFTELEASGSADAQLALGFMHSTGVGMAKSNQAKAIIYYMFSALGDNPLAQMAMGFRYHAGVGVPQSCETALSYYQKVAKRVADGVRFCTGLAVQRTRLTDEADPTVNSLSGGPVDQNLLEYFRMIAENGDFAAQVNLGQIYLSGRGVQQNFEIAYKYFTAAAEAGNTAAFAHLGKMYLDGTPMTPADNKTAFEYFLKAADKANPYGQAGLGIMFMQGRGVKKNYDKAFKLLTLAAEQGQVDGQLFLGEMHYKGIPTSTGLKRDFKAAIKYFQLASQNGHILGYYNLAQMHATGIGVTRSCQHAVDLYKSVAERGRWAERLVEARTAYKEGRHDEAAMKYLFLAELGYEVAQTNLAYILDRGEATALFPVSRENNLERAFVNWQRAANQEYPTARIKLGDYYYYGLGTPSDLGMAFVNYKIAVDRHAVAQAMFNLGYMHEIGEGITRDLYLAKRFYDMAVEHSSDALVPAKLALAKLSFVFLLEDINKHPLIVMGENFLGPYWDIVVMALLAAIPLGVFFLRRQDGGIQ